MLAKLPLALSVIAIGCSSYAAPSPAPSVSDSVPITDSSPADDPTIDLGEVEAGREVPFEVPPDAIGFNVVVTGPANAIVGIRTLVDPRGGREITEFIPSGADAPLALGGDGVAAFCVPSTDATATRALERGRWHLVVGGRGTTVPLRVRIDVQRARGGEFHGGRLDLHVYVPAGLVVHDPEPRHVVDAANASRDASLARRIDVFHSELQRLFGIARGETVFHVIDGTHRLASTNVKITGLLRQANAAVRPALHVVLTNDLLDGGLLGYALPGAANIAGTARSAIGIALYDEGTADNDALSMLHEMGHFAGLLHTEEDDGRRDLLSDTRAEATNLMMPEGPIGTATVTPSQIRVVRGSSIYRAE